MPENTSIYQERLEDLRNQIIKTGCDAFILPRTDEFQGEFLAPYAERLEWLTGFTGSAGLAIITKERAVVMSDGRYTIQLEQQVPYDFYQRADSTKISIAQWLTENIEQGAKVGYDAWLMTSAQLDKIKDNVNGIELVPISNPIDAVWPDQPLKPANSVIGFPDDIAGKTSADKRENIAKNQKVQTQLITAGDSICWLLNVRGSDIEFSPLTHSYLLLYKDGSVDWFLDNNLDNLKNDKNIRILKRNQMQDRLTGLEVGRDPKTAPIWFDQFNVKESVDPCRHPKSIKTNAEQGAIKQAHIQDGVAIVKFLKWLEETDEPMSELSVEEKLEGFRRQSADYLGPSFSTIAGFAENGAIIHYRSTEKTNKTIGGNGLLLVDSGGQYRWGTTDITRTVAIGNPSEEMKENYTRVLKGHIAVASAKFEKGTTGKEIDDLARAPLKEIGLDYAHGTGHGVGCYLCVHEYAASISPKGEEALEAGMLISNEPGYYKENEYGIRIENLILVQQVNEQELCFETITYAPYDPKLIITSMLDKNDIEWLKTYSENTKNNLNPFLSEGERQWLASKMKLNV